MSTRDDLQHQLGEFIHGCLPSDEAERLGALITSDPCVARAYAEAKQAAEAQRKHGPCTDSNPCCHNSVERAAAIAAGAHCQRAFAFGLLALGAAVLLVSYVAVGHRQRGRTAGASLKMSAQLSPSQLHLGETARVQVELENVSGESQPLTVVVVGLPAGLSPRWDQIDSLAAQGKFNSYESRTWGAQEIAFYWRGISASAQGEHAIRFAFDVVAETPGRSTGPASHVYLVYAAQQKQWAKPLTIEIVR